jgi:transforming growth factor-beta-induced protein
MTRRFSMRKLIVLLISATLSFSAFAEGADEKMVSGDIVDIAADNGSFSTLVAALEAADLVDVLRGNGPFTVFAPTDEAFAKLPAGTVEALLGDIPVLTSILLYHVVPGYLTAEQVVSITSAQSASGVAFPVEVSGGSVRVSGSTVLATDVLASNGVIHVVDSVMLPPNQDIVDMAASNEAFSTLVAAVQAADLVDTLKSDGPFTVFAPTDDAFAKLPKGTVDALLKDIPTLKSILLYHVVPGLVTADQVGGISSAETALGQDFSVKVSNMGVFVDQAQVIGTDIFATNGVIHVIDTVILPK